MRVEVTGWVRPGEGPGEVEVFFAREEAAGERFVEWWRAEAGSTEGAPRVKLLPIETLANYTRMRELERRAKLPGPARDIVAFVDGRIALSGQDEVRAGLAGFLNLEQDGRPGSLHPEAGSPDSKPKPRPMPKPDEARAEAAPPGPAPREPVEAALVPGNAPAVPTVPRTAPEVPAAPAPQPEDAARLEVELYYFSDCRHCREALALVRKVEKERGGSVRFTVFDTAATPDAVPRLFALAKAYPVAPAVLPSMVALVGDEMVLGEVEILRQLEPAIKRQLSRGGAHLSVRQPSVVASPEETLRAVTILPIVLAGLADGVNPCAFAAMVLLVSVLSASAMSAKGGDSGSARRQLLLGGGAFIVAVFVTYFLAGLALFRGARAIEGLALFEAIVFWAVWSLAVAGAVLSGADAVVYFRSGDVSRVRLKVPEALRRRFAGILQGRFRRLGLVVGGLVGGVTIAILEGVCTGQMLVPAVRYMAGTPGLRARGVSLLLLYNVLFILPLVAMLAAAVAGVHFRKMNEFLRRHLGGAKVLLAVVFLALAIAMIWQRLSAPAVG